MDKLKNISPGEVLFEEFLKRLGISAYKLSKDIGVPQTRVSQIRKGNRRISADTTLRLSAYFGTSAKFWLGLQISILCMRPERTYKLAALFVPSNNH